MNVKTQITVDFMNANVQRHLSLSELANVAKISRSHLCYLFKTQTGLSPGQYFLTLKMEKARGLLVTSLLSVKAVMIEVGYSSKSHFVKHFNGAYGLTPSEYRTQHFDYTDKTLHDAADRSSRW